MENSENKDVEMVSVPEQVLAVMGLALSIVGVHLSDSGATGMANVVVEIVGGLGEYTQHQQE